MSDLDSPTAPVRAGESAASGAASTAASSAVSPVAAVELRGAQATVGGRTVWRDVALTVRAGEFVAVLGPNGSGKSTLLRAILGLVPTAPGSVVVLGRPAGERSREVGYLPQRHGLDAALPIRGVDLVRLGLDGHRWGMTLPLGAGARRRRAAHERVRETIELVGAGGYAQRPLAQLSGGERQRILIAQALVSRPRLLMPEPRRRLARTPRTNFVAAKPQTRPSTRQTHAEFPGWTTSLRRARAAPQAPLRGARARA